jgi:hypothetical protein
LEQEDDDERDRDDDLDDIDDRDHRDSFVTKTSPPMEREGDSTEDDYSILRGGGQIYHHTHLSNHAFIFVVRTDPEPDIVRAILYRQRSMINSHSR